MANKFEQLIEHIINDQNDEARELFHTIVVKKSRDIYESLVDESDVTAIESEEATEELGDVIDQIQTEEEGISEEEDEDEDDADMELDAEAPEAEEEHEAEVEDRVEDLEDALDQLKAEFDALMAGEAEEPEHAEMDMEVPAEEEMPMAEATEEVAEEDEEVVEESEEIVREYKEKAPAPKTTEEGANTASPVAANAGAKGSTAKAHPAKTEAETGAATPKSDKMTDADTKAQPLKKV